MDTLPQTARPEELAKVYHEVAGRAARILGDFAKKCPQPGAVSDELGIAKAYMDLYSRMLADPMALATHAMNMWLDYAQLWQSSWMKMLGQDVKPVAVPDPGDARFKDDAWANNFLFDFIKQSYLIASRHIQHAVSDVDGLSDESQKKVAFFTRTYAEALAPSNFVMTNPQVLRETLSTGGENLLRGLNNLLGDIEKGDGQLRISMTDENAFQLGKNVATTPGKVVFQTALMQLIQYQPATPEVYRRPLLIIPPWINKYYILDLREKNSFIKWAVDRGHTVFVVSWVNPDRSLAAKGFDDYCWKDRSPRSRPSRKPRASRRSMSLAIVWAAPCSAPRSHISRRRGRSRSLAPPSSSACWISRNRANWACSSTSSRSTTSRRR